MDLHLVSQNHPDGAPNMGNNDLWIAAYAKIDHTILLSTANDFQHLSWKRLDGEIIDIAITSR